MNKLSLTSLTLAIPAILGALVVIAPVTISFSGF